MRFATEARKRRKKLKVDYLGVKCLCEWNYKTKNFYGIN